MNIQKYLVGVLLLSSLPTIVAQTSNIGEITIVPNTQMSIVNDLDNTTLGTIINDGELFIYSNLNNDGVVDHNNNGLTRFEGNNSQTISGTSMSYLYNVYFNNNTVQPAFELSGELSIANKANFNNGIVDNNAFGGSFTFEPFAEHRNTTDDSHVDGHVIKVGDNSFNYPIGDSGYYRYAEISAPNNTGDVFTGKYFFTNPDANYPLVNRTGIIELINDQEYWTITNDSGNSQVLLTLSWDEDTTTPEVVIADPKTAIHIVRWDETRQLWVDEGGVVDESARTVTTPLHLEEYGVFTLARIKEEILLPDDVVVYNAVSPNGDGKNDYFFIDNIQNLANNKVEIFNRWGVEVFNTINYDTSDNVFRGTSKGRSTVDSDLLPSGTYFYVLTYDYTSNGSAQRVEQAGFLYLNAD